MGNQFDSKDMAVSSVANVTDHMLTFNKDQSAELLKESGTIKYTTVNTREFVKESLGSIQKTIFLTTSNPKTSLILVKWTNATINEACETDRYYPPLAQACLKQTIKAINLAIWGCGSVKETAFIRILVNALSNVNLTKETTLVPSSVIDKMKELEDT